MIRGHGGHRVGAHRVCAHRVAPDVGYGAPLGLGFGAKWEFEWFLLVFLILGLIC